MALNVKCFSIFLWIISSMADKVTELPPFYRDTLGDIEDNFQDNLRRGFNNEGARLLSSEGTKHISFQDVAYSDNGVYVSIKGLNLTSYPEFRVKRFDIDLECACINVRFYLGQLNFVADLQIVNKTMFEKLPMVSRSKVLITISGLEADGNIGIFTIEDSFVPKNYYIEYKFDTAEIEEMQLVPNPCSKPERSTFSDKELSPIDIFAADLHGKLNSILHRQLSAVIVEYSVNELLLDERDEITSYKSYLYWRTQQANRLIDNLMNKAQNMFIFKNIEMPAKLLLSYKQDAACRRGTLSAVGSITGFSSITRPSDWNYCQNGTEHIYFGYLSIKDYKFTYNYTTEYMQTTIEGKIKATIYKNKFAIRIQFAKGEKVPDIKIEVYELSDIEIDISGLGSLSWLESSVRSVLIGHIRMETRTKVRDFITRKLKEAYASMGQV